MTSGCKVSFLVGFHFCGYKKVLQIWHLFCPVCNVCVQVAELGLQHSPWQIPGLLSEAHRFYWTVALQQLPAWRSLSPA